MKNRNGTILFSFLLLLSIISSWSYSVSADVTYNNTTVFNIDNENYTFPAGGMTFSQVMINESGSWIKFNDTDFNITASNPINITLSYLNSNDVRFNADTVSGLVWFNISGFTPASNISVKVDSVRKGYYIADASGIVSFSHNSWSDHDFILDQSSGVGVSTDYNKYGFAIDSMILPIVMFIIAIFIFIKIGGMLG